LPGKREPAVGAAWLRHPNKGEETTMSYSKDYQRVVRGTIFAAAIAALFWLPATGALAQGTGLITSVTPSFEVATLSPGDQYYGDRPQFVIISMPAELEDADGIKTDNDDKSNASETYLQFDLTQDADVYIAYDNRATSLPNWMSDFTATGEGIAVSDDEASPLQLYMKTFDAGHVVLGGNMATGAAGANSNYIVLAVPLPAVRISGRSWLEIGETLNLAAIVSGPVVGTLTYQWSKDGGDLTGETGESLTIVGVDAGDEGIYRVTVEDESGEPPLVSAGKDIRIFAPGTLPLAGYLGLGILASGCAVAGAAAIRRKRR
jgi:hypothetical protein